jgi:uncharacterized protein YkwD
MKQLGALVAVALALGLGACSTRSATAALAPTSDELALEQQVYAAVNAHRAARGLRALAWSDLVADQARVHSQKMASGERSLGHRDFKKRVATVGRAVRWSHAAENVVRSRSVARAMDLWLRNRGHRRNIEGNYDVTGIGAARADDGFIYVTQIFLRSEQADGKGYVGSAHGESNLLGR